MTIHTPEQASTLWCPMVRFGDGNNTHSGDRNPVRSRCIADHCAMWRWAQPPHPQDGIDRSNQHRHGFCGLSGQPEVTA